MYVIPPHELRAIYQKAGSPPAVGTYTDKSSIVRWLYWSRIRKMLALARVHGGKQVLDLGCGDGVMLPSLSKQYEKVHGVDLKINCSQMMVEHFGLLNIDLYRMDFITGSFKGNQYDLIFAASSLEHFADRDKLFGKVSDLLIPGGHIIFSSPTENMFYEIGRKMFTYTKPSDHYYSCDEIAQTADKYLDRKNVFYGPLGLPEVISAYGIFTFQKPLTG